jgi:hypothetical protein
LNTPSATAFACVSRPFLQAQKALIMKRIESWKTWLFFGPMVAIAFIVNRITADAETESVSPPIPEHDRVNLPPALRIQSTSDSDLVVIPTTTSTPEPDPATGFSTKPLLPAIPLASQVRHVPNPSNPVMGLDELTALPGDVIDLLVAPGWLVKVFWEEPPPFEMLGRWEGEPFMDWKSHLARHRDGPPRTNVGYLRLSMKPHMSKAQLIQYFASNNGNENIGTQDFPDGLFYCKRLQQIDPLSIQADIEIWNTNANRAIQVALQVDEAASRRETSVQTSLQAPDGTRFWCDESRISGIRVQKPNTTTATVVGPGVKRSISLMFRTRQPFTSVPPYFKLQTQLLANRKLKSVSEHDTQSSNVLPNGFELYDIDIDVPYAPIGKSGPR